MAQTITDATYSSIIGSGAPVVIDFWAEWCGPCRLMSPIIDELAAEYEGKVTVCKCNVDENDDTTTQFAIRSIPTIVFIKDGKQVDKQVGACTKEVLKAKIEALL